MFVNGGHMGRVNAWLQFGALEVSSGCATYHLPVTSGQ